MTSPNKLPNSRKILSMALFIAAVVFNFIAIRILRNLSGDSPTWEYGLLLLFLAAGFGSLLFSQRIRVVKTEQEKEEE